MDTAASARELSDAATLFRATDVFGNGSFDLSLCFHGDPRKRLTLGGWPTKHAIGVRTGKIGSFLIIQNKMIPNVE